MHRPEMWGLVQFTRRAPGDNLAVAPLPGKPARDVALEIYYAQRDFWNSHSRWATNLAELRWTVPELPPGIDPPTLELSSDGYVCAVGFNKDDRQHVWRIRQDRLLKLDEVIPAETETFVTLAGQKYGDAGRRAAWFLVDNMTP